MEAVAHSPEFARKVGIPQKVGKDFAAADKSAKHFQPAAEKKPKNRYERLYGRKD